MQAIDHIFNGLGLDFTAALMTVGMATAGIEQPEMVIYFGYRADGGARILARGFLFDGDCRGESFQGIDIGFIHLPKKLSRVGRQ